MNNIALRLILVGTKSGLVVMCKILTVVVTFLFMHALILLSLSSVVSYIFKIMIILPITPVGMLMHSQARPTMLLASV